MRFYDGDKQDIDFQVSEEPLKVNSCGAVYHRGEELISSRRCGRGDYHIIYVLDGVVFASYDGVTHRLQKGDFLLYPPKIPQWYKDTLGASRAWIHFGGSAIGSVLKEAGLFGGVYRGASSSVIARLLLWLVAEHNIQVAVNSENGILLTILYELGKIAHGNQAEERQLDACIEHIVKNWNFSFQVEDLADMCCLSKSRFMYLFKARIGMPPMEYQRMLRIENAKALLTSTNLSITEIASLCGYDDPLYFSRVFKKKTGKAPRQYRQIGLDNGS